MSDPIIELAGALSETEDMKSLSKIFKQDWEHRADGYSVLLCVSHGITYVRIAIPEDHPMIQNELTTFKITWINCYLHGNIVAYTNEDAMMESEMGTVAERIIKYMKNRVGKAGWTR